MKKDLRVKKGLHIVGDFLGCRLSLEKPLVIKRRSLDILKNAKIEVLKSTLVKFPVNKGATIIFILADSHLALHTWPEKKLVNFDLFLCNYEEDNSEKVETAFREMKKFFAPIKIKVKRLHRE